jgi:hypothetical protein
MRLSLWRVCPYVPFVLLTAGYLVERYFVFHNLVREKGVGINTLFEYGQYQATQLQILVFGRRVIEHGAVEGLVWVALALTVLWGGVELNQVRKGGGPSPRAVVFYFGVLWWLVSTTPLLVTYFAGRHLYLAAVGPVIALGVLIDALWSRGRGAWRAIAVVAGVGLILASAARLQPAVADWNATARVSQTMVRDVERELSAVPVGSLVVLDVPPEGPRRAAHTWLWSYALPYALQPPFTDVDLTERVFVIGPPTVYCCPRSQWLEKTRANVAAWVRRAEQSPVVLLQWDAATGAMDRRSDAEDPSLRSRVAALTTTRKVRTVCAQLNALLADPGETRDVCELDHERWYLGTSS